MLGLRTAGWVLQRIPRNLAWLPALAWMALITALSSMPSKQQPGAWWWSVLSNGFHAPLFGLLALWFCLALPRDAGWPRLDPAAIAGVLAGVLAFSLFDEFHQSMTPGRDFSLPDVVTNLCGAACVLWTAAYVNRTGAEDRGLGWRLLAGVALCLAAALLGTWLGARFAEVYWL